MNRAVSQMVNPSSLGRRHLSRLTLAVLSAAWLGGIIGGGRYVLRYETTPGIAATPDRFWPRELPIQRADDRPTIVMIAQPSCSCTRASVGELETVLSQHPGRVKVFIIFEQNNVGIDPRGSSLWADASRVSGATVLLDQAGGICRQLRAATSGQVFVYDRSGKLCYSGGITGSRGHAGENDGSRSISSILDGKSTDAATTSVFGCSLK